MVNDARTAAGADAGADYLAAVEALCSLGERTERELAGAADYGRGGVDARPLLLHRAQVRLYPAQLAARVGRAGGGVRHRGVGIDADVVGVGE